MGARSTADDFGGKFESGKESAIRQGERETADLT